MAAGPVSASAMTRRRMWVLLGAIGSLLVIALVVLLIVWRGGAGTPGAVEETGRPQPHSSPAPLALAAVPEPTSVPDGPHPSTCDELYSPEMVAAFDNLVLNPAWVAEEKSGANRGSDDQELIALIDAAGERLTCVWANENGGSGLGLTTELMWVTSEQSAAVLSRLSAAGMNCYEELGGMRCIIEGADDGGVSGESHFLRDGIWLATHYINAGPDGYTHDMIANVWAGA
ncbi:MULTISPECIES: hypothetical protein [Cryobacterium]|uniref:DUF3558 domain-containing protein n=1 Tax=Cryobacterium breve TaxID=1259258 RepID=A0ABY2J3A0_9MICO|nr:MULTISPECIES: hypothetical protein [Cryobacterium]TFC91816.1 hypothetical protein E3T20_13250 [Cryobacterium sp. TmT3-12]TFC98366.1 hypothetical protein E3O65_08470 [Cryobacterium breve]